MAKIEIAGTEPVRPGKYGDILDFGGVDGEENT